MDMNAYESGKPRHSLIWLSSLMIYLIIFDRTEENYKYLGIVFESYLTKMFRYVHTE